MEAAEFWKMVSTDPHPDGCWLWQGNLSREGYGVVKHKKKTTTAHRLSYELAKGAIGDGLHVDHLCFNRACVNPAHLEAVTPAENSRRTAGRPRKPYSVKQKSLDTSFARWLDDSGMSVNAFALAIGISGHTIRALCGARRPRWGEPRLATLRLISSVTGISVDTLAREAMSE